MFFRGVVRCRSMQLYETLVFPPGKPLREWRVPLEDVRPFLKPEQLAFRQFPPKLLGPFRGSLVQLAIALHPLHVGLATNSGGGGKTFEVDMPKA